MSKSSLMDLMNTDFSDEDSDDDQESQKLFEKYGNANPIHEAIENDDAKAIPLILKSSGKLDFNPDMDELVDDITIDQRDQDEYTPLHLSLLQRKLNCVEICLQKGAALSGPSAELLGSNPLHLAVYASAHNSKNDWTFAVDATNMILKEMKKRAEATETNPISVHTLRDARGRTPLHVAVALGALQCTNALIRYCKSKDAARKLLSATNDSGQTVLHVAMERVERVGTKMEQIVKTIVNASLAAGDAETTKALVNMKDMRNVSTVEIAKVKECTNILENVLSGYEDDKKTSGVPKAVIGRSTEKTHKKTCVFTHSICVKHLTCEPSAFSRSTKECAPSENIRRLTVLCDKKSGALRASEFKHLEWKDAPRASMADVLRVHEYAYVSALQTMCKEMDGEDENKTNARTRNVDRDTTISKESFEAGLYAAGATIRAVESVVSSDCRNAFCAVRPPGHHAGPRGKVASLYDQCGSHGFCLFNNAAIAAAYARVRLGDKVKRVAIVDFDVHHGNGTEAILRNLRPSVRSVHCRGPWHSPGLSVSNQTSGLQLGLQRLEGSAVSYKPWADDEDAENVFFASTHGYGKCADGGRMYPGSGETCGVRCKQNEFALYGLSVPEDPRSSLSSVPWNNASDHVLAVQNASKCRESGCTSGHLNGHFDTVWDGKIVNCGMTRKVRLQWRLNWADNILPALHEFNPDLIIISAGFDAHFQDEINHGFIGLVDDDYAWLTSRIVQLANDRCDGRVVSALEGGYRVQGEIASPFARSVSAHVSALQNTPSDVKWSPRSELAKWESSHLKSMITESSSVTLSTNGGIGSSDSSSISNGGSSSRTSSKRRRRATVDYTKLNEEMENERKKAKSDE